MNVNDKSNLEPAPKQALKQSTYACIFALPLILAVVANEFKQVKFPSTVSMV